MLHLPTWDSCNGHIGTGVSCPSCTPALLGYQYYIIDGGEFSHDRLPVRFLALLAVCVIDRIGGSPYTPLDTFR